MQYVYRRITRVSASLLAMVLLFSACNATPVDQQEAAEEVARTQQVQPLRYSQKAGKTKKEETVFVRTSAAGEVLQTTVTDWLHTETPEVVVADVSALEGIRNVSGAQQPERNQNRLTWHMDSTDLYYSGTTQKKLPVRFEIQYRLNGVQTVPEKIVGKSGTLQIQIKMINEDAHKIEINGKTETLYTPFLAIGGLVLPGETFTKVTLDHGKTINDATKQIAMVYGMPGINASLQLNQLGMEGLDAAMFPEDATIQAEVTDFQLGNIMFAVIPLSALELDMAMPAGLDDVKETLAMLSDLENVFHQMNQDGALTQLFADTSGIHELARMANETIAQYQSNRALLDVVTKYMTPENIRMFSDLLERLDSEQFKEVMDLLSNPALQMFFQDLPELAQNMQEVKPVLDALMQDMEDPQVQKALDDLPKTLDVLAGMKQALDENEALLNALETLMQEDNLDQISALLSRAEGLMRDDSLTGMVDATTDVVARMKAWLQLAQSYRIYTEVAEGMDSSVMFLYETESMQKEKTQQAEAVAQAPESKQSLWDRLFGKRN